MAFGMLIQSPLCFTITTNLSGIGNISVQIPGTFAGFPPSDASACRYFKYIRIAASSPKDGTYVDNLTLEDTDGVIPAPYRAAFPSYPVILDFSTDSGAASGASAGYFFDSDGKAEIRSMSDQPTLLPSGLYLKATIHSGLLSLGQTFRCNLVWGRMA